MLRRRSVVTVAAALMFGGWAVAETQAQETHKLPPGSTTYPIHFPLGGATLAPKDQDTIRAVAAMMRRDEARTATIVGKADTIGSDDFNHHLAEKRARAVFEALVYANKVPESRVEMHWTGEHLPFVSTDDEKAEAQNRVVAIILH